MKRAAVGLCAVFLILATAAAPQAGGVRGTATLSPRLQQLLRTLPAGGMTDVIVHLRDQADPSAIGARIPGRPAQLRAVIETLQAKADSTQGPVRDLLAARQAEGRVAEVTPFWIFNGFAVTATADVIEELAARLEVMSIRPDDPIQKAGETAALAQAEANIQQINAPDVWALGFRGQGIVVASMDTGVDFAHPDISAQYRGGTDSWYDPYGQHPQPTDADGHGTMTMGIMVGRSAGGTAVGVAPDAKWIAVKIFNDSGGGTIAAAHKGFQWLLDPDQDPATPDAPQVVNNSWTFPAPGCDIEFQPDLQTLRAAGIVPVFAAGNLGPGASTSTSPSNNPEALSVGAVDSSDSIASFSSRGPPSCGGSQTFPELTAPGVNIRTTDLFGTYNTNSGTSFSAPHVTGALAILLSAFPSLSVAGLESALETTAVDLGPAGPDSTYGFGRIDVLAAYSQLAANSPPAAVPSSVVVSMGTLAAGSVADLGADDSAYFQVDSTTTGKKIAAWYGSFLNVPNGLQTLKITYKGHNSLSCAQSIDVFDFRKNKWKTLDTQNVGPSEVAIGNLSPPGKLGDYVSGDVPDNGELRVQIRCQQKKKSPAFTSFGNFMTVIDT